MKLFSLLATALLSVAAEAQELTTLPVEGSPPRPTAPMELSSTIVSLAQGLLRHSPEGLLDWTGPSAEAFRAEIDRVRQTAQVQDAFAACEAVQRVIESLTAARGTDASSSNGLQDTLRATQRMIVESVRRQMNWRALQNAIAAGPLANSTPVDMESEESMDSLMRYRSAPLLSFGTMGVGYVERIPAVNSDTPCAFMPYLVIGVLPRDVQFRGMDYSLYVNLGSHLTMTAGSLSLSTTKILAWTAEPRRECTGFDCGDAPTISGQLDLTGSMSTTDWTATESAVSAASRLNPSDR